MERFLIRTAADALKEPHRPMIGYIDQLITWRQLVRIEPRLAELLKEIRAVRDPGGPAFCANDIWYGRSSRYPNFRMRMSGLVGWDAEKDDPILRSSSAYDLVYRRLNSALPACRNCICL